MVPLEDCIAKSYYDEEDGFGSMAKTLKDAKNTTIQLLWKM
jgi:hypothetical protein